MELDRFAEWVKGNKFAPKVVAIIFMNSSPSDFKVKDIPTCDYRVSRLQSLRNYLRKFRHVIIYLSCRVTNTSGSPPTTVQAEMEPFSKGGTLSFEVETFVKGKEAEDVSKADEKEVKVLKYYIVLEDFEKTPKLGQCLDAIDFDHCCVLVSTVLRAKEHNLFLLKMKYPVLCLHQQIPEKERCSKLEEEDKFRIVVSTQTLLHELTLKRVNLLISYDMELDSFAQLVKAHKFAD